MKKGTRIGNVFTDEMKEVIRNKDLTSQQVGDILRAVLYPSEFEIKDGTAKYIASSLQKGYVSMTFSCAESRRKELERLNNHYSQPKVKCPEWFPSYYKANVEYLGKILITLENIISGSNNISEDITNVSLTLDKPPITCAYNINNKYKYNTKSKSNDTDTNTDTIPPKSPEGLKGESSSSSEPVSMLDNPAAALGLPDGQDSANDGRAHDGDEVAKIAAEIEGSYRYKVNRGKLRKCLKSVLKKNSAAEVIGGYRRWLAVWEADDFQWAPSRITDWLYDAKFLEKPRRGNTRAAPQVDPDTVSSGAHLDLV